MENKSKKELKRIQQKQIKIKGMHCKSCAAKVERGLRALKGIKDARVSFLKEQAFIRFDSSQVDFNTIDKKIQEIGYKVSSEGWVNNFQERIIRIRLENPNILMILVAIALILTFINFYRTTKLQNQLASVINGVVIESEGQSAGEFKEVAPQQLSQPQQPSRAEVGVDDDPIKGSENAPVTIIEFSEYECPFCERFFKQTLPQIEENYIKTGKVRHVFRDFPLSSHRNAQKAAEASECADEQGKFWEYHDKLFENQNALDINSLKRYAKDLGLDAAKFNECLDSGKMTAEIQKDFADGSRYGVSGTPTFFINEIELVGAQPFSAFEQVIEQELNKEK